MPETDRPWSSEVDDLLHTAQRVRQGDVCPGDLQYALDKAVADLGNAGLSAADIDGLRQKLEESAMYPLQTNDVGGVNEAGE